MACFMLSPRFMLLCTAASLSYSFVLTIFIFQFWIGHDHLICNSLECNNISMVKLGWSKRTGTLDSASANIDNIFTINSYKHKATVHEDRTDEILLSNVTQEYLLEEKNESQLMNICPEKPSNLIGFMNVKGMVAKHIREDHIIKLHPELSIGGAWKPPNCLSRHKITIIVAYRDRKSHLNQLLNYLIPMLQRQLLDFRFIVAEQYGNGLFNKGRIMNAAFLLSEQLKVNCVIFHDVDMFPDSDHIPYSCPDQPLHLGAYVDQLRYNLLWHYLLGGVVAIRMDHYRQVNGHSNLYWGWGGEDDDLGKRVLSNNMSILRLPKSYATYTMLNHAKRKHTIKQKVQELLKTSEVRWPEDGLNKTQWTIVKLIPKRLYYHLYVDVGVVPDEWRRTP